MFCFKGMDLLEELRSRGLPHERILKSHDTHQFALTKVVDGLKKSWGCTVQVIKATDLSPSLLKGVDAVFTAGGDGTVLETAANVFDDSLPVITVNTDPVLSKGFLCAFKLDPERCFVGGFLDKLRKEQFSWLFRSRIEATVNGDKPIPRLALNEVFFAEQDAR